MATQDKEPEKVSKKTLGQKTLMTLSEKDATDPAQDRACHQGEAGPSYQCTGDVPPSQALTSHDVQEQSRESDGDGLKTATTSANSLIATTGARMINSNVLDAMEHRPAKKNGQAAVCVDHEKSSYAPTDDINATPQTEDNIDPKGPLIEVKVDSEGYSSTLVKADSDATPLAGDKVDPKGHALCEVKNDSQLLLQTGADGPVTEPLPQVLSREVFVHFLGTDHADNADEKAQAAEWSHHVAFGPEPVSVKCVHCSEVVTTKTSHLIGIQAIIDCMSLLCIGLSLGCCLIPFLLKRRKDVAHDCRFCGKRVGYFCRYSPQGPKVKKPESLQCSTSRSGIDRWPRHTQDTTGAYKGQSSELTDANHLHHH